jgi:polysaccharide export outer membrane protein
MKKIANVKTFAFAAVITFLPLLAGLAAAQNPAPVSAELQAIRSTYVFGPDDQLVIHILDVPDIDGKTQRLDPSGDLRLPMVGRVHAGGMTLEQLEAELTKRFKVFLNEPDISITMTELHNQSVSIIGAVGSPGVHQFIGNKTLIEALSMGGGVSADAGPIVKITRRMEAGRIPLPEATVDPTGAFSTVEINVKGLLDSTTPEKNIVVRANDIISVPRAAMVYVVGDVTKPGEIPLRGGRSVTVSQAISESGGIKPTGAGSRARILRVAPGSGAGSEQKRTEIPVDISKILSGKTDDVLLLEGDILTVPESTGRKVGVRTLETALTIGTLIVTYAIIR